jgi:hypothetical protein
VAKAFGTFWIRCHLYEVSTLNSPCFLVKTISSYLQCRKFQTSLQPTIPARRRMLSGEAHCRLVYLFTLYLKDMLTPSCVKRHANDTSLAETPRKPSLLVSYMETHLGRREHWLREWRIAINVSKDTAVLFAKTVKHIQKPRPVQFFGEPIQWFETAWFLRVTLDSQLTWTAHINHVRRKAAWSSSRG